MTDKFKKLLLFGLIYLFIFINSVVAIQIISISHFKSFVGGGTIFVIVGTDFPSIPTLQVVNSAGGTNDFELIDQVGDTYRWRVPPAPKAVALLKRRRDYESTVTLVIKFDGNIFHQEVFYFLAPMITSFSPHHFYPNSNNKILTVEGDEFSINNNDPLPQVMFINGNLNIPLVVDTVTQGRIACRIPNNMYLNENSYTIQIVFYTGHTIRSLGNFRYVLPTVRSIEPLYGIGGKVHKITINGDNFIELNSNPNIVVSIGGLQCTNLQVTMENDIERIICNTQVVNPTPGQYETKDIQIAFGQQQVYCDKVFTIYEPKIISVNPKRGIYTGGTDVTVLGQYIKGASVFIGATECIIDQTTVQDHSFVCKTGAFTLGKQSEVTTSIQLLIGGRIFNAPDTEKFKYYSPQIASIEPNQIINVGSWPIVIRGGAMYQNNLIKINDKILIPNGLSDDKSIYTSVDPTQLQLGVNKVNIISDGYNSNVLDLTVVKPSIVSVAPDAGYAFSETLVVFTFQDLPSYVLQHLQIMAGDKICINLLQTDNNKIQCTIPPGTRNEIKDVSFSIKGSLYQTTVKFYYFEPTINSQTQSTNIPKGGGNLLIKGNYMNFIGGVKIDSKMLDFSTCTVNQQQISCIIPPHTPGSFSVILIGVDRVHEYNTNKKINYVGPSLSKVEPSQGSSKRKMTLTITGTSFGTEKDDVSVMIGDEECTLSSIRDTRIICKVKALKVGLHAIAVEVLQVAAIDLLNYKSNALSCLGPPLSDNSNSPVDWWFIYKIKNSKLNTYLYIDPTKDKLERLFDLQDHDTDKLSALQATFDQYSDYYYMFFNDQPGQRKKTGARGAKQSTGSANGHVKGMVFFDDEDDNGKFNGIHIEHSNPTFPSYKDKDLDSYNGINSGVKFLGKPDYSQHFFCYNFDNLDRVMEYFLRNDAYLLDKFKVFDDIKSWDDMKQNQLPFLYDYLSTFMTIPDRNPPQNDEIIIPTKLIKDCSKKIINKVDLEDICWWHSPEVTIGGNLKAYYFMKSGNGDKLAFPKATGDRPDTLSPFVLRKEVAKPTYDGIDLWMVVANFFQKKMFVECFYAIKTKQMQPTEQVLNVGFLELPVYLAEPLKNKKGELIGYTDYISCGGKREHAKFGFPMYPAYGNNALDANENFFCVGDSNRHNGQEIKDPINDKHYSKFPKYIEKITSKTISKATDVTLSMQSLRTSRDKVTSSDGEESSIKGNPTMPEPDIMNYIADDTMSLHYIAFDDKIGSVCSFEDGIVDACDRSNARATLIERTLPKKHKEPKFPPKYNYAYDDTRDIRTYDLLKNNDFLLVKFAQLFMAMLPNANRNFYQFMVDTNNNFFNPQFRPPFIIRTSDELCQEEVAYLMTLQYIYYQSDQPDPNVLMYKIGGDNLNWGNGIIIAISKKLLNNMDKGLTTKFPACMSSVIPNYNDIEKYIDDKQLDDDPEKMLRRTISAAWDWMSTTYSDGQGKRLKRLNNAEVIPVEYLLNMMIKIRHDDMVNSLIDLVDYIDTDYQLGINFQDILYNNYIIQRPPPKVPIVNNNKMVNIRVPLKTLQSTQQIYISQNERELESGVQQLLKSQHSMNISNILSLSDYEIERLELALDKWIVINNQNQAIKTLISDPINQYHDQPIEFIDMFNMDQTGNPINLGYQGVGNGLTRINLNSPISIASITFILESFIKSQLTNKVVFGDFEVYYIQKNESYGLAVSTLNSQLCDIKMMQYSDYSSNNFDYICSSVGPIITSVDILQGSTKGAYPITISGKRFDSSMTINIGNQPCDDLELISEQQIVCTVPSGVGQHHLVFISTPQAIFNIQRTQFLFSYNLPVIESIEPQDIYSYDMITISGYNFGSDATKTKVMISDTLECSPIVNISDTSILCFAPEIYDSNHQSISVIIQHQHSNTEALNYAGPNIDMILPESGDPLDPIVITGEGFSNLTTVFIDDIPVDILNQTLDQIIFELDYETASHKLTIQNGDLTINREFTYYPPIITLFNDTLVNTSGGLVQLYGFGLGLVSADLNFQLNNTDIDCNPFDHFIECYIPPGFGSSLTLIGSVSDQLVDFGTQSKLSYRPPVITSYLITNSNVLEINGYNFAPIEYGFVINESQDHSFIRIVYNDFNETCYNFISTTKAECNLNINSMIQSIEVVVGDQISNTIGLF
ncbi:hypothetical protein PPL_10555 [Heterostelium album PN500]|uniref:IPT/TIG domain-containing protein n=1 Tax=Heterostelium pallidum (strain ATCC 26659 / Pp 5 / PN500) TaxID=670386 RepID=D3BRE5_HETP5|nr:hypothetical protein PPL_10555 [Heterostelium album PN500]EFA75977.1 hypothetical protein PPL_10555 [Heterostelium album PN500]|eukprot:XP_020428111.1 hypothetical protein PPL_10555 [Heterostelium album PN500]